MADVEKRARIININIRITVYRKENMHAEAEEISNEVKKGNLDAAEALIKKYDEELEKSARIVGKRRNPPSKNDTERD